jgi:hypothetical protein
MSICVDKVLGSRELFERIASYCGAEEASRAAAVSRRFHGVFSSNALWEKLCAVYGFKSLTASTRTRGQRSFRSIYMSSLCLECRGAGGGAVVIDTEGGRSCGGFGRVQSAADSLFVLCQGCFSTVREIEGWSERRKFGLPHFKKRCEGSWLKLLMKIPDSKKANMKKRVKKSTTTNPAPTVVAAAGVIPSMHTAKRSKKDIGDPESNDHLLRLL